MRLIDADILDKALTSLRFTADGKLDHWGDRKDWCLHGSEIEMLIANAPTVEAEPIRHGEWITESPHIPFAEECSNCGGIVVYWADDVHRYRYQFCPHCGAHMDKAKT